MAGAGRVIAGIARGRVLLAPGEGTRPYADRLKQALFAMLEPDLPDAAVLDLFAGSGAGGIEARSRGAARVVFVEKAAGAIRVIRENLRRTGLEGIGVVVVRADVEAYLAASAERDGPFDIVLVDAPFDRPDLLASALAVLGAPDGRAVRPGGLVVARTFWRSPVPGSVGLLASDRRRRVGDNEIVLFRRGDQRAPRSSSP